MGCLHVGAGSMRGEIRCRPRAVAAAGPDTGNCPHCRTTSGSGAARRQLAAVGGTRSWAHMLAAG